MGGIDNAAGGLISRQTMGGSARAATTVALNAEVTGFAGSSTEAAGNALSVSTLNAVFALDAAQTATGDEVRGQTVLRAPGGRLLGGGQLTTAATANGVSVGGPSSSITGVVDQAAGTTVFASTVADVQYLPAAAEFSSQALSNAVLANTTGASHQDLAIRQTNAPSTVEAQTDVYVDNAWDLTGSAQAGANKVALQNAGGSMIAAIDQTNEGRVRALSRVQTNLQGRTTAYARAAANEATVGNNDIYLKLDNNQLNSGGVEASATYAGVKGYDVQVGADAVGNTVTGYACSQCGGEIYFNNTQVNNGAVSAVANATLGEPGRNAVVGANAVGNSATFYISRPGG